MQAAGVLHQGPVLGIAGARHVQGKHPDAMGLETLEIEVEEVHLKRIDATADDDQGHRFLGGGQMQVALDGLAPKRDLQLLEGHLEQASGLAIGHVAEQLGLICQLVVLEVGVACDGVVAHGLEQALQRRGAIPFPQQRPPRIEITAGELTPLIDPVAGHIALDGVQIAFVTALPLPHGDVRQGLLHLDGIGPLPGPGRSAQQAIPAGRQGAIDEAVRQCAVLLVDGARVGDFGSFQYLFDPGKQLFRQIGIVVWFQNGGSSVSNNVPS